MNPNGMPDQFASQAPPPATNAKDQLNAPSMMLMVVAIVSVLFALFSLITSALGLDEQMMKSIQEMAKLPPGAMDENAKSGAMVAVGYAMNFLQLVACGVAIFGAMKMRALQMWPLALTANILMIVPCFSGCCCLIGLPVGIWGIVMLTKPEIKAQFT